MRILKNFIKWLLLALAVVIIALVALWVLNGPEELVENSQSQARLDQAEYSVAKMDLEIIDRSRATPALGDYKGDDKRTLNGTIWFPKGTKSVHPLVIYSHGFAGYHNESSHIAKYLARNGYVVAAVNFPLSNRLSPAEVPQLLDVVHQPNDVSAVIDHLLALNNDSSSAMHQRVDPHNIGAMGLSLGGLTTALVSFHPDLKDERIKAAAMMAPPLEAFSEQFYASNTNVKSLLLSGTLDRVVPEQANATEVKARHPNGWFVSLEKGSHLGFADIGNPLRWMENPDNLGCALMNRMLPKLDLPERWDAVIANTDGVLRDVVVGQPCPDLPGESMNNVKQQWLSRIAIGSFFDMYLRSGAKAASAKEFFIEQFGSENSEITLRLPL
jgi:dienelactone hydrolase